MSSSWPFASKQIDDMVPISVPGVDKTNLFYPLQADTADERLLGTLSVGGTNAVVFAENVFLVVFYIIQVFDVVILK